LGEKERENRRERERNWCVREEDKASIYHDLGL
jgi:hypothetical protein